MLREYAAAHTPSMTAEEFSARVLTYLRPQVGFAYSAGGALGQKIGKTVGLRSKTKDKTVLPAAPVTVSTALLCVFVSNGITIEQVQQGSGTDTVVITGSVPSSKYHYTGLIAAEVATGHEGSVVEMTVIFPGQLFAWGSGKRLISRIYGGLDGAIARVSACEREGLTWD